MWINAIRLSFWERSRCNEIWTGSLLGVREPRPLGWQGYDVGLPAPHSAGSSADGGRKASAASGRFEGWLKARLPGDTEWRRVWAVVVRGSSVPSRASVVGGRARRGEEEPQDEPVELRQEGQEGGRDRGRGASRRRRRQHARLLRPQAGQEGAAPLRRSAHLLRCVLFLSAYSLCPAQSSCSSSSLAAAAIYPDHDALLESSTLFKVEGTFLSSAEGWVATGYGVGGRAEKQGYAYMMLEEGSCVDMLHWIVGIADAFKVRSPLSSLCASSSQRARADVDLAARSSTAGRATSRLTRATPTRSTSPCRSARTATGSSSTANVRPSLPLLLLCSSKRRSFADAVPVQLSTT